MRRIRIGILVPAVAILAVLAAGQLSTADTKETKTLDKKLDEVLSNQRTILQKLEEVLEEVRIVKVRATHS